MVKVALITGGDGLIGNYLIQTAPRLAPGWRVLAPSHRELDLTDFGRVSAFFRDQRPDLVVHCAAISKTPACEANPGQARKINFEATRLLAELSANVPFVFCSSDLVFDGKKGNYVETDQPHPQSVYTETKVAAEQAVLKNPRHTVLRLSLNYGHSRSGNRAFNEEMLLNLRAGRSSKLFTDEYRCPIPAMCTAQAIWELVGHKASGIFHLAGVEKLSRLDIGLLVIRKYPELRSLLIPSSLKDYEGAPRSPDTSLNCAKIQKLLSFPLPAFSRWLMEND